MSTELAKQVERKAEALEEMKIRFETLLKRIVEGGNKAQLPLPDFEAYGWERFEEFLNRLDDAVNIPLLERARTTLEKSGFHVDQQTLDRIKSALPQRRETLLELLEAMSSSIGNIRNLRIQQSAKDEILKLLGEGKWDELVKRADKWRGLETNIDAVAKDMSEQTHLYNSVFDRTLEEGPDTSQIERLLEIERKSLQIGGHLKERIRFESPRDQDSPLRSVYEDLDKIARKKEDIRNLLGSEFDISQFTSIEISFATVEKKLDSEYQRIKSLLDNERQRADKLVTKCNMLARLLKKTERSMPLNINLKSLDELSSRLDEEINEMHKELEKSLSQDARQLIDNLFEGTLPESWATERLLKALNEILSKGCMFEVRWRE